MKSVTDSFTQRSDSRPLETPLSLNTLCVPGNNSGNLWLTGDKNLQVSVGAVSLSLKQGR